MEKQNNIKEFTSIEKTLIIIISFSLIIMIFFGIKSFNQKPKILNGDEAICYRINELLAMVDSEEFDSISDVIIYLVDNGYLLDNLTPSISGNNYIYNSETNRFALVNDFSSPNGLIFGSLAEQDCNNWIIVDNINEIENTKTYSHYLSNDYYDEADSIKIYAGLDVGNYFNYQTITYINSENLDSIVVRYNFENCQLYKNPSDNIIQIDVSK